MPQNAFDAKDFRRALGQFPTGVTVMTTVDENGDPVGMTASSFNSVSIDPPLILWSIGHEAHGLNAFRDSEHFSVNILSNQQIDLSNRFASRGTDKFKDIEYSHGTVGCPLFERCAAQLECRTWKTYDGGDHTIIVGEVLSYKHSPSSSALVFHHGAYAVPSQHPSTMRHGPAVEPEGFTGDFMLYLMREVHTRYGSQLYPKFMQEHGITAEEWRVLSMLSDQEGAMAIEDIVPVVLQPVGRLRDLLEWMAEKGYLAFDEEQKVSLTDTGKVLSNDLLTIAKEHEDSVLSQLDEPARRQLKDSLKSVIKQLDNLKQST